MTLADRENVRLIQGREAWVKLDSLEMLLGAMTGIQRTVEVLTAGRQNRARGLDADGNIWTRHIEGALAEVAVAKAFDRFWGGAGAGRLTAPKATGGDVGKLQIRLRIASAENQRERMIVQARDFDGDDFVLVVGRAPTYRIVGWMTAGVAKQHPEWIDNPGGYGEAWFVPQAALQPLSYLAA